MKRKQAVLTTLEELDAQAQLEQQKKDIERLNKRKDNAKPSLIKRVGAGFVDFLFMIALAFGMFVFATYVIFPKTNYEEASETLTSVYETSGLYILGEGQYFMVTEQYDEEKTPEENFDDKLIYFFTHNERAINQEKLKTYNEDKLASGLFVLQGENYVRKAEASDADVKAFLSNQYVDAVAFLFEDPVLLEAYQTVLKIVLLTIFLILLISSDIFYMVIPLVSKRKQTLAYMLFKLIPVDGKTMQILSFKNAFIRNLLFIAMTYLLPVSLYVLLGSATYIFIFFFVNTIVLCFSKRNVGIHDLAVNCNVINLTHSNAFTNLEIIKGNQEVIE